jgi:hypothetical protein
MLAVIDQAPDRGSYTSAVVTGPLPEPPGTRTVPLGSSVAVWLDLTTAMLSVVDHVPVAGSKSSAE